MANIDKRFPSIPHMKATARRRMPGFAWEYMTGGIGLEENVRRNTGDLQKILFMPHGMNAVVILYRLEEEHQPVTLSLRPLL